MMDRSLTGEDNGGEKPGPNDGERTAASGKESGESPEKAAASGNVDGGGVAGAAGPKEPAGHASPGQEAAAADRVARLKVMLEKEPRDSFLQHALAMEYVRMGNDAAARSLLEEVLERDAAAVGSYYQLGKVLERLGEPALALTWYEKGMDAAKTAGERRSLNELRTAYDELADE